MIVELSEENIRDFGVTYCEETDACVLKCKTEELEYLCLHNDNKELDKLECVLYSLGYVCIGTEKEEDRFKEIKEYIKGELQ